MTLCGSGAARRGFSGWLGGGLTFAPVRHLPRAFYGSLGCATPSATQAYLASRTRRSARVEALSALSQQLRPWDDHRPGARAPVRASRSSAWPGPLFGFAAIAILVFAGDPVRPARRYQAAARPAAGHGAAMSYPSLASTADRRQRHRRDRAAGAARLKWNDPRIRGWILAGVIAGHAQAATLACLGFFVIDRLHLAPHGSEQSIAIVMMAGAAATLAAQWGLIPRLRPRRRAR